MEDYNLKALPMWNSWSKYRSGIPVYDTWLDDYKEDLNKNIDNEILDLGCGIGADTEYLIEKGYKVISADYSNEALKSIDKNIKGSTTIYLDMNHTFPFEDNSFSLIIADISLHYFDNKKTMFVMNEIKRILKSNGILLARVSSINDIYYGAGSGTEIEERFYNHGSYAQRYFNEDDLYKYFEIIGKIEFTEKAMTRNEAYYSSPKMLYQVRVVNN